MRNSLFLSLLCFFLFSCKEKNQSINKISYSEIKTYDVSLDIIEANKLAELPLGCIGNPLPYKAGLVIEKPEDLAMPIAHHPAFYGCFDWHSAVHGHWSLVYLIKQFPNLEQKEDALLLIDRNLSKENIEKELAYFSLNSQTSSFERTYGWAWLLKLQEELYTWNHPLAKKWYANLEPLAKYISKGYISYLPKLVYPIRTGTHSNTAFGLSFAYDYAKKVGDTDLKEIIEKSAKRFYDSDVGCPIAWEPSGHDFLSPCLQELDIMRKVLNEEDFAIWLKLFLPQLNKQQLDLEPGIVLDRTDGHLVHLDGLNFSRAWCLYPINNNNAQHMANEHLMYSLSKIKDGDYAGQHWLASFALYAFKTKNTFEKK